MKKFASPQSPLRLSAEPTGFYRYLSIGCVVLAGMLTLFFFQWVEEGRWLLKARTRVVELSAQFLPVPFAYLAWVYLMDRMRPFKLSFSPVFCSLSMVLFLAVPMLRSHPQVATGAFLIALISGFFVLLSATECARRIREQPRAALVACFAATASFDYYNLLRVGWETMCNATAHMVYALLQLFQYNAAMEVHYVGRSIFSITSPSFSIIVFEDCGGLEGIFLFSFLLSVMLLVDWELFKRKRFLLLYGFGIIYMFFVNVLRIFSFFTLGYWAYRPDAWPWVQAWQGAPIYLFHSYVGWVFYLVAFSFFASWMYRPAGLKQASSVS